MQKLAQKTNTVTVIIIARHLLIRLCIMLLRTHNDESKNYSAGNVVNQVQSPPDTNLFIFVY